MLRKIAWRSLFISIGIPLAVGAVSALLSMGGMKDFDAIQKPPLSPPGWLFPIVWTVLYILMGISCYRAVRSNADSEEKNEALKLYFIQLAINFLWSILFFSFKLYSFSAMWLLLLLATVVITALKFYKIDKISAYLFIPYILWLLLAAYLNIYIAVTN